MSINSEVARQLKTLRNVFVFLQIPAGLILLLVLFLKLRFDIDTSKLTQDSNSVADQPLYIGLVSNLGILFWCATAAISLFTGRLGKSREATVESFLIYSGILSIILLLDDLFQLHEEVFQYKLHIPEELVLACYGIFTVVVFFRHRKIIPSTNYLVLFSGLLLFGFSLTVDTFLGNIRAENLVEDGSKFLGILTWFGYYASLSYETIKKKISAP